MLFCNSVSLLSGSLVCEGWKEEEWDLYSAALQQLRVDLSKAVIQPFNLNPAPPRQRASH